MGRTLGLLIALTLAAAPAHGAYSGLTLIPTADVLGPGEVCLDQQLDGPFPVGSGVEVSLLNTQLGIGSRAEVGIDFDFTEGAEAGALFNGKLLVLAGEKGPALAVGVHTIGEHLSPVSYLAATHLAGERLRLHGGAFRTPEDDTQGFTGLDYAVSDRLQLWAEQVRGRESASAISLAYQFAERWGMSFAWQRPNDGEAEDSFSLHIGCTWAGGP